MQFFRKDVISLDNNINQLELFNNIKSMPDEIQDIIADFYFIELVNENTSNDLKNVYKSMLEFKIKFRSRSINLNKYKLRKYERGSSIKYIKDKIYRDRETNNKFP